MINVKDAFIALSRAYREVCRTRKADPVAYYKARIAYEKLKEGYPSWLVREAERFVREDSRKRQSKTSKQPKAI